MAHIPVLFNECMENLAIKPDGIYLDMTMGGFGHGGGICERLSEKGIYIGIDKDNDAIARCREKAASYRCATRLIHADFKSFRAELNEIGIENFDGCLVDLGVSSFQLDEAERGFSFGKEATLDMRMDLSQELSAYGVVNEYSEEELKRIISLYGEERFASKIAREICIKRVKQPITLTTELAELVSRCIPYKYHEKGKNPATRTFQAIRIEVNGELDGLYETLNEVIASLNSGGRLCVISFHSLEDRIVKEVFSANANGCICPKDFPICVCGRTPKVKLLKDVTAKDGEKTQNPRSRSARLRTAVKI